MVSVHGHLAPFLYFGSRGKYLCRKYGRQEAEREGRRKGERSGGRMGGNGKTHFKDFSQGGLLQPGDSSHYYISFKILFNLNVILF